MVKKVDEIKDCKVVNKFYNHGCGGAVYGLGVVGAAIYFISGSTTFWAGVLGFLKALVWPAYLVYYALKYFGI